MVAAGARVMDVHPDDLRAVPPQELFMIEEAQVVQLRAVPGVMPVPHGQARARRQDERKFVQARNLEVAVAALDAEANARPQGVLAERANTRQRRVEMCALGGLTLLPGGVAQAQVLVRKPPVATDRVKERGLARDGPGITEVHDDRLRANFGRRVDGASMRVD